MTIIAIDPSFTRTGLTIIQGGQVSTKSIVVKAKPKADIHQKCNRIDSIVLAVLDEIRYLRDVEAVAIEGPAFGNNNAGTHYLAGLWWALVTNVRTYAQGVPMIVVQPTSLKMFATGKGNADKDAVMLETARRYAELCTVENNDQADSLVLAAIAHYKVTGELLVDLPESHTRALEKIQ